MDEEFVSQSNASFIDKSFKNIRTNRSKMSHSNLLEIEKRLILNEFDDQNEDSS